MPIVLYYINVSAPCRAVQTTAEHLGIELVLKHVNLPTKEQLKPEFLAINPQHTVPVIDDNGFKLWESRAILRYLINKYAPESPLYPKDPKERAVVDKMLDFDLGNLSENLQKYLRPQFLEFRPPTTEEQENLKKSLAIFEKVLESSRYAAGNHLTIADYSIIGLIVAAELGFGYNYSDYPKISAWIQRMKKESPKFKEFHEIPMEHVKERVTKGFKK